MIIGAMRKNLRIILIIGISLLIIVISLVIFLGRDKPANSEIIDNVAKDIEVECQEYVNSKRYSSVYALCQKDGLYFRIDDLSNSPAERVTRFKASMQAGCYAGLNSRVLRITNLENERMVISAYLLADYADYPDFKALQKQLIAAGHQIALTDICESAEAISAKEIRFTPLAWSSLADSAETLVSIGSLCEENVFRLKKFGIVGLICNSTSNSEIVALDLGGITQQLEDVIADGFEYMSYCPENLKIRLIKLNNNTYIMIGGNTIDDLHNKLVGTEKYRNAEIIKFCIGISR